ncbi:MAG: hypothetical protein ACRC9R_11650, partial [Enterovibrio sp.]
VRELMDRVPALVREFTKHFIAGTVPQDETTQTRERLPFLRHAGDGSDYIFHFPQRVAGALWARNCSCNILADITHAPIDHIFPHIRAGSSLTATIMLALQARKIAQNEAEAGPILIVEDLLEEFIDRFARAIQERTIQERARRLREME